MNAPGARGAQGSTHAPGAEGNDRPPATEGNDRPPGAEGSTHAAGAEGGRHRRARAWLVVAGGGTGGHIYPGLAVAEAFVADGRNRGDVHFAVSRRPLDAEVLAGSGFDAKAISARGLQRRMSAKNLLAVGAVLRGLWQSWWLLGRLKPGVVLAQGGYVSLVCALAARLRRIPVVVLEANATPGLANRVASRWAAACAVSLPNTPLARSVATGLPVRPDIAALAEGADDPGRTQQRRAAAQETLGVEAGRKLVVVLGGSLGAGALNGATAEVCELLADRGDLCIRHVVGAAAAEAGTWDERPAAPGALQYQPLRYETDMPTALAAADLVVSRAGGGAVAELSAAGRPGVLVPLPQATDDHQSANAAALAASGGALVLPEGDLSSATLVAILRRLLDEPDWLAGISRAAAAGAKPDAAEQVLELLRQHARTAPAPAPVN